MQFGARISRRFAPRGGSAVLALVAFLVSVVALGAGTLVRSDEAPAPVAGNAGAGTISLPGYRESITITTDDEGTRALELVASDGTVERFTYIEPAPRNRSVIDLLLHSHSRSELAWVAFGLLGQMFFAGRMIVQWIVSERHKRSVVPPIFWWLSVTGSAMLFTYFLWRRDIVGILGQGLPLLIYVRNLMLIYGGSGGKGSRI